MNGWLIVGCLIVACWLLVMGMTFFDLRAQRFEDVEAAKRRHPSGRSGRKVGRL